MMMRRSQPQSSTWQKASISRLLPKASKTKHKCHSCGHIIVTKSKAITSASLWRLTKLPTNCEAAIPNRSSEHKQAGDNPHREPYKECISLWQSELRFWCPLIQ